MKKILIISSLVLAFVIAGCSQKTDVEIDETTTETTNENSNGNDATSSNSTMQGNMSDKDANSSSANNNNIGNNELGSVYFKFDKFDVEGTKNINTVKNNAKLIAESKHEVRVEGNTDEWGSDEYNYALALKRASSIKDRLVNDNVELSKIKLVSYGESKPKCTEKTKQCWQENRRVDFVLVPNN